MGRVIGYVKTASLCSSCGALVPNSWTDPALAVTTPEGVYCSEACADEAAQELAERDVLNPWPAGDLAMCDELEVMDIGMGGVEE